MGDRQSLPVFRNTDIIGAHASPHLARHSLHPGGSMPGRPPPQTLPRSPAAAGVARYDPARDLGPLFQDVQLSGIFADSKTFVDARPLLVPAEIAAAYASARSSASFSLRTL